jgi:outer membrane protein assembly factor BamB
MLLLAVVGCCVLGGADWRHFRGAHGTSFAARESAPRTLGEESLAWKIELPGRGPASPIVVGDRVFICCSDGERQGRLLVLAFDADRGRQLWRREFWATGRTLTHPFSAVAAPTPASDGSRIFAFYSSNDLIALDLDGNLLWYRGLAYDYPKAGNDAGMGSSPVVVGDTVVVQVENQGESFAAGIDAATGETRWRLPRDQDGNWVSPVALPALAGHPPVVLLQGRQELVALNAKSGQEFWRFDARCSTISSLAVSDRRIYLPADGLTVLDTRPFPRAPTFVWGANRMQPNSASPLVDEAHVYIINSAGVLVCADAQTGRIRWQQRIGGKHWSTPAIAGNRLYCFNQDGQAKIVELGRKPKVIASTDLEEPILASPAVADNAIFIRSDRHLWKFASP